MCFKRYLFYSLHLSKCKLAHSWDTMREKECLYLIFRNIILSAL